MPADHIAQRLGRFSPELLIHCVTLESFGIQSLPRITRIDADDGGIIRDNPRDPRKPVRRPSIDGHAVQVRVRRPVVLRVLGEFAETGEIKEDFAGLPVFPCGGT